MYLLILLLPLLSAIIAGFFGRQLGSKGAGIITTTILIITTLIGWVIFYEVGLNGSITTIKLYNWVQTGNLEVPFGLLFDSVTSIMLIVVTTISALVHLYSTEYMSQDPHLPRFMSYLSLFTFFMLVLVTADNLLQLFIGWEGVGVCSYLLINFWYTRIQANKSAIKAMIVNRIGDIGITLGIFTGYYGFGSIQFNVLNSVVELANQSTITILWFEVNLVTLLGIFLLIGAVGKSAQLGLHTWLPDAMEGPTPVSALIHAATMVTAGVFLLIRTSAILESSITVLTIIVLIGALTAFFAATVGVVQNDIKKVIAYSTCSQLGYMVFAIGISNYSTSLFHLMNHAFFKGLLFLSAGSVIHAIADEQDFRKLGGLLKSLPFTYTMMLIGSLSLMGFPFLTGYYSKDAILELAYTNYSFDATFAHWLGTISAFFTAFYSFRLLYFTFLDNPNAPQQAFVHSHESNWKMSLPLFILGIGSIFVGYLFKDLVIGVGTDFFGNSITVLPHHINLIEAEFLHPIIKFTPVILSIFAGVLAIVLLHYYGHFLVSFKTSWLGRSLYIFFNNKWHFDFIFNTYIVKPVLSFGYQVTYKVLDRGLFEFIGPIGISRVIISLTKLNSIIQSGVVNQYAFLIFLFTTLYISIIYISSYFTVELLLIFPILILLSYSPKSYNRI